MESGWRILKFNMNEFCRSTIFTFSDLSVKPVKYRQNTELYSGPLNWMVNGWITIGRSLIDRCASFHTCVYYQLRGWASPLAPHEKKRKWWVSAREAFFQLHNRAPGFSCSAKLNHAKPCKPSSGYRRIHDASILLIGVGLLGLVYERHRKK